MRSRGGEMTPVGAASRRRRPCGCAAALAVAVMALGGCGSDDKDPPASTAPAAETGPPQRAFSDVEKLAAGKTLTTTQFKPAIRFKVPSADWASETGDNPTDFSLALMEPAGALKQAILSFHRVTRVFDPKRGGVQPGDAIAFDGDFADWLRDHPHLRTTTPTPVKMLGLSGVKLDATVRSSPPKVPDECDKVDDDPCVSLWHDGFDDVLYWRSTKGRFAVLDLPAGGQLVVQRWAEPATEFKHALKLLEPMLANVEVLQP